MMEPYGVAPGVTRKALIFSIVLAVILVPVLYVLAWLFDWK